MYTEYIVWRVIIFGGDDDAQKNYNDAWVLDLTSNAWRELTTTGTKPSARFIYMYIIFILEIVLLLLIASSRAQA